MLFFNLVYFGQKWISVSFSQNRIRFSQNWICFRFVFYPLILREDSKTIAQPVGITLHYIASLFVDDASFQFSPVFFSYFRIRQFYGTYFSRIILVFWNTTILRNVFLPYFGVRQFYDTKFSRISPVFWNTTILRHEVLPYFSRILEYDIFTTRLSLILMLLIISVARAAVNIWRRRRAM